MDLPRRQSRRGALLSYASVFLLGSLIVLGVQSLQATPASCNAPYDLLNPRLQCKSELQRGEWDYEPLRNVLLEKKEALKNLGALSHLSIYFRDLDHGPRFGIGEYDQFQPASLRKVPVMIAYLHMADVDPTILDKTLSFSGALKINPNVEQSEQTIDPNTPYTVRELLTKMIVYSDNYSYTLLTEELNATPPVLAYYTFRDLDVLRMMMDPKGEYVSIQSYASLFAVLYNTGYLSKEMSQFALELLTQATFRDGLVAGTPPNTRVAHKFGQRFAEGGEGQLHDCGIVYHPDMRYILCVMTSGTNFQSQQSAIADVSRIVYNAVSSLSFGEQKEEPAR